MNPPRSAKTRDTLALFDPAFGTGQFRPAFLGLTVPLAQLPATVDQRVAADPFMQHRPVNIIRSLVKLRPKRPSRRPVGRRPNC